ncbi:carbohydrate esterase family 4 protein [Mycena floridula]|nr:carbohydrate esterase family 4 protein [Mycena floridula]
MLAGILTVIALATLTVAHSFHSRAAPPKAKIITSCKADKTVALTFDDGPYKYLYNITKTLNNAGAKGTFFFNGNNWDCIYSAANVAHIKYAYESGHQMASHSWSHPHFNTLNTTQMGTELDRVNRALKQIVGVVPAFFRPPYGEYNNDTLVVAASRNMSVVIWDFDAGDAAGNTWQQSQALYKQTVTQTKPRTLLPLNHEVKADTAYKVLPYVLALFKQYKWKMVTLAECLGQEPYSYVGKAGIPDAVCVA